MQLYISLHLAINQDLSFVIIIKPTAIIRQEKAINGVKRRKCLTVISSAKNATKQIKTTMPTTLRRIIDLGITT